MASIASAISSVDPKGVTAAAATAAPPPISSAAPLAIGGVQKRTHLTVTGNRLFELTSSRALDALDAAAKPSVDTGAAIKTPAPLVARTLAAAPDAPRAKPVSLDNFAVAAASAGVAIAAPSDNSLSIGALADRLADEASSLSPSPASHGDPLPARGPMKELQFQLEPADLGKVAVRLRMSTGKLTVDIGVASPGALVELEKQRDTMSAKLNTNQQPLESLVIHQQSTAESHDVPQTASPNGFSDSTGADRDNPAPRQQGQEPPQRQFQPTSPKGASAAALAQRSDLVV